METKTDKSLQDIVSHAKEYGFVFPSSEIYDGLQAVYDLGPFGVELRRNIHQLWWKAMTLVQDRVVGLDAAIFMHPKTWKASGHVDSFNDPMIDNKDSKKRYRADQLIELRAEEYNQKGDSVKAKALLSKMASLLEAEHLQGLKNLIEEENIVCEISGTANWTDVRQFNLMFSTQVGSLADEASQIYLRPETAQGIFVNFLNVQKSARMKIPFGIAQIGKAFRNEIVARQFIFRMREFEQMEMQYFVRPGTEMDWFEKWKEVRIKWHQALGIPSDKLRIHTHEKLAHYANAAVDIEYEFPFGFREIEGIHSRTDFDLKAHMEVSRKKIQYFDNEVNQSYIPYVVETSAGSDRLLLMHLAEAYTEEVLHEGEKEKRRIFLKFHPAIAPVKAAILPLTKKDGLPEKAKRILDDLKFDFKLAYEDAASIGKRYTRQDLIGTPYCIAVDHETLGNDTVTIRDRNTTEQVRIPIKELWSYLHEKTNESEVLKSLKI